MSQGIYNCFAIHFKLSEPITFNDYRANGIFKGIQKNFKEYSSFLNSARKKINKYKITNLEVLFDTKPNTPNLMECSIKQNVNLDATNLPNVSRATSRLRALPSGYSSIAMHRLQKFKPLNYLKSSYIRTTYV